MEAAVFELHDDAVTDRGDGAGAVGLDAVDAERDRDTLVGDDEVVAEKRTCAAGGGSVIVRVVVGANATPDGDTFFLAVLDITPSRATWKVTGSNPVQGIP